MILEDSDIRAVYSLPPNTLKQARAIADAYAGWPSVIRGLLQKDLTMSRSLACVAEWVLSENIPDPNKKVNEMPQTVEPEFSDSPQFRLVLAFIRARDPISSVCMAPLDSLERGLADQYLSALYEIGKQPFVSPYRGRVLEYLEHFDPQEILDAYREFVAHHPNRNTLVSTFSDGGRAILLARRKRLNYIPIPAPRIAVPIEDWKRL